MMHNVRKAGKGLKNNFTENEAIALFKLLSGIVVLMFMPPIITAVLIGVFIFGYAAYRIFD